MSDIPMSEDDYQPRNVETRRGQFVVLSGCSGAGKSALLTELANRGYQIFGEPGRQIVKEQLHIGGDAVPWGNVDKFIELTISRSIHQMVRAAATDRLSFFDRGIVDAFSYLERHNAMVPEHMSICVSKYRYHEKVFMAPPWREIYRNDNERRHSFDEAVSEYNALVRTYEHLGYEIVTVPKLDVNARADFILAALGPFRPG